MSTSKSEQPATELVQPVTSTGMTTVEKIYTGVVIACAMLLLVPLLAFHVIIIPQSQDPSTLYFVAAILWIVVLSIAITSAINLSYRSLLIVPTIIQCVMVCFMIYFCPVGIWGGYLLYRRIQRSKNGEVVATT
ncbi:MAG TPA: hypothetical protein VGM98_04975 [Schlesneria sp.]|jgi:hypothetical protein